MRWVKLIIGTWLLAAAVIGGGWGWSLNKLINTVEQQQFGQLSSAAKAAAGWQRALGIVIPGISHIPWIGEAYQTASDGITLGTLGGSLYDDWNGVNPLAQAIPPATVINTQKTVGQLNDTLKQFEAHLRSGRIKQFLTAVGKTQQYEQMTYTLDQWNHLANPINNLISSLPHILGYDQTQHYVVLLQNNMELRPTGGFMGSYADFYMERGKLTNLTVQDIYVPDGQIKGYVKEPAPIRNYLFNQEHPGWRLRDSNWNPDFPTTKKAIEWFFTEGKLPPIDGMAAINLIPVLDIVKALGPLSLPDYRLTLTPDNFYQETQAAVETDFFPGSTQKRDFLGTLGKAVLEKLSQDSTSLKALLPIVYNNLETNQILVSFDDPRADSFFSALHWNGALATGSCPADKPDCLADYAYWNEANLGSNKTNCCIIRQFADEVTADNSSLSHRWTLQYKNNNPGTPAPPLHFGGGYKNYLRLFIPKENVLDRIEINGKAVPLTAIDAEVMGETVGLGFLNLTEGGQASTITIQYHRPITKAMSAYTLTLQKQSGIDSIPLSITYQGKPLTEDNFRLTGFHRLGI